MAGKEFIYSPFKDFGEGDLEECYERIQNPIGKPLLIVCARLGLNCPNRSISVVKNKYMNVSIGRI